MKRGLSILLTSAVLVLCACSSDGGGETVDPIEPVHPTTKKMPISISTSISDTRATDNAFEKNDCVGLYVVNHKADGTAGTLQASGNYADNVRFTYNSTWTPDTPIYWQDNTTQADFYLYYPYTSSVNSVSAMPFSVSADQSSEAAYKNSDFMIGSTKNVAPTEEAVKISAVHVMSQMVITLVAGNGFTEESLAAADVSVKINGIKTQSTVDFATATVTPTGSATTVTPLKADGSYKALIVPQEVADGNLITVTVDGRDFNLPKAFTFVGGKRHRFTVTLSKTSNGINVNITKWEDDGIDNGGTAE